MFVSRFYAPLHPETQSLILFIVKRLFFILLLAATAANVVAQAFDPATRYRIELTAFAGDIADRAAVYSTDPEVNSAYYRVEGQENPIGQESLWYIRRAGDGWTVQNAATLRYLAYQEYTVTYNWNGETHSYDSRGIKPRTVANGDSAVWLIDFENGSYTFCNKANPEVFLGVYAYTYTWEEGDTYTYSRIDAYVRGTEAYNAVYSNLMTIYAEDGTVLSGQGTPGGTLASLRIGGKMPVAYAEGSGYMVTVPEMPTSGTLEADVTWLQTGLRLEIEGAETTETGFRIAGADFRQPYPFRIVGTEDEEVTTSRFYFTTMPIAEITCKGANGSTYVVGSFRLQDNATTRPDTTYTAQFKYRGATAQRYAKKSFNVKLLEADGVTDLDANLLGLRNTHTWILDAMYVDGIRMRNRVCFDTWNEMDRLPYATNYGSRNGTVGRFVEVFVNGEYRGLYCFTDKINRKLLNLTKVQFNVDSTEVTPRGLLYKGKQWGDETYLKAVPSGSMSASVTWGGWELEYPDDYPSVAAWTPLRNLINYGKMSQARFEAQFAENYYLPNLVNYVTLQLAYNLEDNGMKNMFISTKNIQKAGKQMIFTVWDMDSSLGGLWDGTHNDQVADTTYVTRVYPLARLFSRNWMSFRDSVRQRWEQLRESTLSYESLSERLTRYADLFVGSGAWGREYAKWGAAAELNENLYDEVDYVLAWYRRNRDYLDELLPPLPTGIGSSTFVPAGTEGIYTLDGRRVTGRTWQQLPPGVYIVNGRKTVR